MMKILCFTCVFLVASVSMAENKTNTVSESFWETLPDAVADATLIDLPLCSTLWGFGMMGLPAVPLCWALATGGYSIRKTCNDYSNQGNNSALCGFIGGAVKYTGKAKIMGEFTNVEPLLGAIDAGTYEGTASSRGVWPTAEFMAIEAGMGGLAYVLRPKTAEVPFSYENLGKEIKGGATIGALVSVFVYTSHFWYEVTVKSWVKECLSSFAPETGNEEL